MPDESAGLRDYVLANQEVTDLVRNAGRALQSKPASDAAGRYKDLLVRLAEDRFNLVVVGQFKRGKSTLMNAIIGRDLLPTGALPLTSAITAVAYGPRTRVMLVRRGWTLEQEIQPAELADYVTELGNPGNERALVEARIEVPLQFLRRGLYFVDTPGMGSAIAENTATTYAFLPQADAVILVTGVDAPLSEVEERFLGDIREQVRRLFVVVNKTDILDEGERDDVLGYVRTRLSDILRVDGVRVHPVSAREALGAKLERDNARLARSGLPALEAALTAFLAEEQGRTFLVSILDRLATILSGEPGPDTLAAETLGSDRDIERLHQSAVSARERLLAGGPLDVGRAPGDLASDSWPILEGAVTASQRGRPGRLESASSRSGTCPICAAQGEAIFQFFASWQLELATSKPAQSEFVAARGFCPAHSWQFSQIASPSGISAGYAPLIDAIASSLDRVAGEPSELDVSMLGAMLATSTTCPGCGVLRATETTQVAQLLGRLQSHGGLDAYLANEGLCLPHLATVLASDPPEALQTWLVRDQVRRLEELSEDMRSYSLKREAIRRGLLNARERHAWRRAIVQLVGERVARGVILAEDHGT